MRGPDRKSVRIARRLCVNQTDAEAVLWNRIRNRQIDGHKFVRQVPIGDYICDFVCLSERVIVEVDGSQHVRAVAYDSRRDAILRSNGFRILRFWNADVMARIDTVLDTIFEALVRGDIDGRF